MTEQTHTRHVGDTRTVLPATLKQPNAAGVDTVVDLAGLTVQFRMVDQHGVDKVTQTGTGVTVTDASAGEVQYDFSAGGVDTAGKFYGYFIVVDGSETDHFPVVSRDLVIDIKGNA